MSSPAERFQGATHEGAPQGKWEKIGGVDIHVATPSRDYPRDKAIIYLTDAEGAHDIKAEHLVDDFAVHGFKAYIPDYLHGEPIPSDVVDMTDIRLPQWVEKHSPGSTRPPLDKVIAALKEKGVTFGATGYCFGGPYVFDLAFENITQVAVVSHPALKLSSDLEKYVATSKAPLLINSCEIDSVFPAEACAKADALFGDGKFAPGYKREYFEGCERGFSVRDDLKDETFKAGKEGALKAAIGWFSEKL